MDDLLDQVEIPQPVSGKKKPKDDEPTDIDIDELKSRALKEVRQQKKIAQYEKSMQKDSKGEIKSSSLSHNLIYCTKAFLEFYNSTLCDNMVISTLFYISSSLWLRNGSDLNDEGYAEQERIQADSMRIMSSLYCQLLLSPLSTNLRVREERVFYETLIFFLDMCACFATRIELPDMVYELIGNVFRKGLQEPHSRKKTEFLPITEIVRRHWLSQRVPGKVRAEIKHSTLQGTTDLISPMCEKELPLSQRGMQSSTDIWEKTGFPKGTELPLNEKIIPREMIIDMFPKQADPTSQTDTRAASPK